MGALEIGGMMMLGRGIWLMGIRYGIGELGKMGVDGRVIGVGIGFCVWVIGVVAGLQGEEEGVGEDGGKYEMKAGK